MTPKELLLIKKLVQKLYSEIDIKFAKSVLFKDTYYKNGKLKYKVDLLTQNQKLKKEAFGNNYGIKKELAFYALELLPFNLSGVNLCAFAKSCVFNCIAHSGKGNLLHQEKMFKDKILTPTLVNRAIRTYVLINDKDFFMDLLLSQVIQIHKYLKSIGIEFWLRPNGFSDIDFETEEYDYFISKLALHGINCYDYTKDLDRKELPNYRLTYSHDEGMSDYKLKELLDQRKNVAVIFSKKKKPTTFKGFPVIDGDINDNRAYDPSGVIIGLSKKGTIGTMTKTKNIQYV